MIGFRVGLSATLLVSLAIRAGTLTSFSNSNSFLGDDKLHHVIALSCYVLLATFMSLIALLVPDLGFQSSRLTARAHSSENKNHLGQNCSDHQSLGLTGDPDSSNPYGTSCSLVPSHAAAIFLLALLQAIFADE